MKKSIFFLILSIVVFSSFFPVFAGAKVFYYSDEIDRRDNLAYAYANPYDAVGPEDVSDFDRYNCISLDDYNSFAMANPFDAYDPLTAANARTADLKRLSRNDFNRIADENLHDWIDRDDFSSYSDMQCWSLKDYNGFAETNNGDRYDPAYFRDFDDLDTVQKVGSARYHFFGQDEFESFDLYDIRPRARADIYYPGFYDDYRPYYYDMYGRHNLYPLFGQ